MMFKATLRRMLATAVTALALVLGGIISPAAAQGAATAPNVVLILDASRSMWGQIEGVNKVVSVRNVISELAREMSGKASLGLVAYGHRQSSGCDDIELVLEPERHEADSLVKTVNAITPKGSTPIAASLVKAAEAAGYTQRRASLILIADGLDNCRADPCETASNLKRQGKDLKIHAVAFDAKKQDELSALSCVADNTGGTFAPAANEAELTLAVKAAFRAALTVPLPRVASAAAAAGETGVQTDAAGRSDPLTTGSVSAERPGPDRAVRTAQTSGPGQEARAASGDSVPVTLAARTVDGGAIIKSGLVWWIYKNARRSDGKYQLVETLRDATPTAALPPGSYRIAATYGKVNLIKDIDVEQGKALQETFILNAGGLRLNAVTLKGTTIPPNSVRYDIFADESESDQFGNRKIVLRDAKPGVVLRLNAGAYHVVSTYGDANAIVRADVTVESGRLTDATINHSASKVTFKLVNQPGGEALADTQWNILTPGGDIVKESAGALPTHILAAGSYSVLARHQGKNFTREFSIEPGEAKQIEVVIQ